MARMCCLRSRSERLSTHEDAGRLSRLEVILSHQQAGRKGRVKLSFSACFGLENAGDMTIRAAPGNRSLSDWQRLTGRIVRAETILFILFTPLTLLTLLILCTIPNTLHS